MRVIGVLTGLGLLLGSLLFAATPVAAGDPCYHGFDLPARTEGAQPQVRMLACAFAPTVVRVAPGTTVEWVNELETHLLTGANQEWGFRDEEIRPRERVAFRFDRPGTYPFACALHRGMVGAVVVGDGVALAAPADAAPAVVQMKRGADPSAAGSAAAAAVAPAVTAVPPPNAALATPSARTEPASRPQVSALVALGVAAFGLAVLALLAARRSTTRPPR
jgi:plastocyanin